MKIKDKIVEDFKEAFRQGEKERKAVLSSLNSEIKNKEIELGKREEGLSDEETIGVVKKALKQREDAVDQYQNGGRNDLAEKEQKEAEFIKEYLPEQMSSEAVEEKVKAIIEEQGASGPSDLGKVMGRAMQELKGAADGGKVREIAQKLLQ
ncbi:MAG: GatB/YqeY domain-containing protein [Candidatus Moranbacteria bacterium]|nr:GatB/YqeY domain-containing protein [Candidatus Moranbacteria bacterium]